jgi:hypothetical protein
LREGKKGWVYQRGSTAAAFLPSLYVSAANRSKFPTTRHCDRQTPQGFFLRKRVQARHLPASDSFEAQLLRTGIGVCECSSNQPGSKGMQVFRVLFEVLHNYAYQLPVSDFMREAIEGVPTVGCGDDMHIDYALKEHCAAQVILARFGLCTTLKKIVPCIHNPLPRLHVRVEWRKEHHSRSQENPQHVKQFHEAIAYRGRLPRVLGQPKGPPYSAAVLDAL